MTNTNTQTKGNFYKVNGWLMSKNQDTWELEKRQYKTSLLVTSILFDIDGEEDLQFFEGEISKQLNCDWFQLDGFYKP
jgi:hypothetical protein